MKKILALYMPQFHTIPENDKWWGEGYTEWKNVLSAKKYNKKQYQPRVPLNENYYNLLDSKEQEYQAKIAKENGIYGFCYYHYWFTGKLLLEKPMENMLKNKNITLPFCISWANHTWRHGQGTNPENILIKQEYGDEKDWAEHFNYLLPFFLDKRYIKIENKPVFVIHDSSKFDKWNKMMDLWCEMAKKAGLAGIYFVHTLKSKRDMNLTIKYHYDAQFEFQPTFSIYNKSYLGEILQKIKRNLFRDYFKKVMVFDYNKIWNNIIRFNEYKNIHTFLGGYIDWDNTPRWKNSGNFHVNANPQDFKRNFSELLKKSNSEFIFINAWNEWGEGAYMEPDEKFGFGYLKAIKEALEENDEFEMQDKTMDNKD